MRLVFMFDAHSVISKDTMHVELRSTKASNFHTRLDSVFASYSGLVNSCLLQFPGIVRAGESTERRMLTLFPVRHIVLILIDNLRVG